MATNNLNGLAAQSIIQGNKQSATLVGISERYGWDNASNRRTDSVESLALDVVSPATRFNKVTINVPIAGCSTLGITDADLENVAQTTGIYPLVKFEGLTTRFWSSKENSSVQISASATKVYLCDESGVARK